MSINWLIFKGAGQDVGRSCILLHIGGKNIMLDCGMHMGFQDEVRYEEKISVLKGLSRVK